MADSAGEFAHEHSPETWLRSESTAASRWLNERTAERQAAFLLPHLRPGMDLLDCRCGPGSITAGLARRVAPGRVVGVDADRSEIELMRRAWQEWGDHPEAFFADAYCEAVAWKPIGR